MVPGPWIRGNHRIFSIQPLKLFFVETFKRGIIPGGHLHITFPSDVCVITARTNILT